MSTSKKNAASESKTTGNEAKTETTSTTETSTTQNEEKGSDEAIAEETSASTEAAEPTVTPEPVITITEEDIEGEPALKLIGVEVGDSIDMVAYRAVEYIKEQIEAKAAESEAAKELKYVPKDHVIAVKDGEERSFPNIAWNNLGPDKNGWVRKVETPKEAIK